MDMNKRETGQKMLEVLQILPGKGMYRRLNSTICPRDTIVYNKLHHNFQLHVLVMSRTAFRVIPHSLIA